MKFLIAGSLLALAGLNTAAATYSPDTTFNNSSSGRLQVYYDIGGGKAEEMKDTTVASSTGAIYSVGSVDIAPGRRSALLVKRLANGLPDNTFSLNKSWMKFDAPDGVSSHEFTAVAYSNAGAVYVGGSGVVDGQQCAFVRRIFDNPVVRGAIDYGFSAGRFLLCSGDGTATTIADIKALPDGKSLVLINHGFYGEQSSWLYRLKPDGTLDNTFGQYNTGVYEIDVRPGRNEVAERIAVTGNTYLIAGSSQYVGDDWDGYVVRVLSTGYLDTSYAGGVHWEALDDANSAKNDRVADLVTDASGRAVLLMNSNKQFVRAIRLTTSGARDTTFNGNGLRQVVLADMTGGSGSIGNYSYNVGAALAINSAQQIWVAGSQVYVTANGAAPDTAVLAVARLTASGIQQAYNIMFPYGQDEYGVTATVTAQDRLLLGTRLRTTTNTTDYDFGYLRLLGTP